MKRNIAVIMGNGNLKMISEDVPDLQDNQVLVKVEASLISPGTEMALVKRLRNEPDKKFDNFHFGYSSAGVIVKTKGNVKGLKEGMRVAAMGGPYACHANYACVPVNLAVPIPDNVSFEQACYLSLAATSLQAVRRTLPQIGEFGTVLGQGIVGNIAAQLCQIAGARVIAQEGFASRIAIAKKCGIKNSVNFMKKDAVKKVQDFAAPYGLDFAVFAFGGNADKALTNLKPCMKVSADGHEMGRVILVGGCTISLAGGANWGNMDFRISSRTGAGYHDHDWEFGKDYPAAFVQFTSLRNAEELVRLMAEKRLVVTPMTTHRMPLAACNDAADLLCNTPDKALGVLFEMNEW